MYPGFIGYTQYQQTRTVQRTTMQSLSRGAIQQFNDGVSLAEPVVQVLQVKCINTAPGKERFRLTISDGQYSEAAMLATQVR